jgi:hypothetical protein
MPDVMILAVLSVAGRLTSGKIPNKEALNIIGPKRARKRKNN